MRYDQVLSNITRGARDPDNERLYEIAQQKFIEAISGMILQGEYNEDDLPAYFKLKEDVEFNDTGGTEDLSGLNLFRVDSVFVNPESDDTDKMHGLSVTVKPRKQIEMIGSLPALAPSDNDVYVYRVGNDLKYLVGASCPVTFPLTGMNRLWMTYIEYPDNADWDATIGAGTELVGKFSLPFLWRGIELATKSLIQEEYE